MDGLLNNKEAAQEVLEAFKKESLTLGHGGAIELTASARTREVAKFNQAIREAGLPDSVVQKALNLAPGQSRDKAVENFLVQYYRAAGTHEGAVLDKLTAALGSEPKRAAIQLAQPIEALQARRPGRLLPLRSRWPS